jgi:DNA-binding beta-propeller fold protein YncE
MLNSSEGKRFIKIAVTMVVFVLVAGGVSLALAQAPEPHYKVDPYWPKELPNNWIVGQVGGMYVDSSDHIWIFQRPASNTPDEISADPSSPRHAMCCFPAPPVMEFDAEGTLLKSWGGPGKGYDWPKVEHGILVDKSGNVWLTGSGVGDRQVLEFTNDGKFLKQIGHPSKDPANSLDSSYLGQPAGLEMDEAAHELYVSDGYLNKRVIVYDSETLAFKRMWGAYGNTPSDADPGAYDPDAPHDKQFRSPVHCVRIANDGLVYVCDRINDRVQVFTKQGKFQKEFFIRPVTQSPGTVGMIVFSKDSGQEYMMVADPTNNVVWTLRRSDGQILGSFGHDGRNAGQFHAVHSMTSDSAGNIYTGEVESGKRIQKFMLVK